MAFDFDALHQSVLDYFRSREMKWGGIGFGEKPAILIIDMAYGWTDPQYPGGSLRVSRAVDWIAELLKVARPLGVPIVYTTSPRPYCLSYDCDISEEKKKALAEAHRTSRIDDRITPQPDDKVIYKTGASAFFNTDLFRHLKILGVDTLMVTGCSTSACVKASVMDSEDYGLKTVLVRDCINDRSETEHEWHIRDLTRWADVVSLAEAGEYLKSLASK